MRRSALLACLLAATCAQATEDHPLQREAGKFSKVAFVQNARQKNIIDQARTNVVNLLHWKFQLDPQDTGLEAGWAAPSFDDSPWPTLKATQTWQAQGQGEEQPGIGWYRSTQDIPAEWSDSKVLIQSTGVIDEYDLYVNGKLVRHFGAEGGTLAWDPTETDIAPFLKFGQRNTLALKVTSHGRKGGVYRRIQMRRVPPFAFFRPMLPAPVLDARPELVNLYWQAWRMAFKNLSFGTPENKFVPAYMEEGYNEQIYQWDSIFMSMYGRYAGKEFPAMQTLDNFYAKQEADGYIARIYSKTDGGKLLQWKDGEYTVTNPPLFAWAEWDYYRQSGDSSRLARVLPILEKYDAWLKKHQRSKSVPGMYWQTGFDSGMDNMPRPNADGAGWVDMTLQQALAARYLALISRQLGDQKKTAHWRAEFRERSAVANRLAWNEKDGIYYDVDQDGNHTGVKHIGAMWAMLAGVASPAQAKRLQQHLQDPKEFFRPHLFPALAASDAGYTHEASYWRGGVWAPTNYMTIKGLQLYGSEDFAHEVAMNHLTNMERVYSAKIDEAHVDPNEANADYHTIWECYNPDQPTPCTRADATYYGRQDFAGWTALGPIALFIQEGIGLEIVGAENTVRWHLREPGRVGIANMELTHANKFSVLADGEKDGKRDIEVSCEKPFTLSIQTGKKIFTRNVPAGTTRFSIPAL